MPINLSQLLPVTSVKYLFANAMNELAYNGRKQRTPRRTKAILVDTQIFVSDGNRNPDSPRNSRHFYVPHTVNAAGCADDRDALIMYKKELNMEWFI